MLRYFHNTGYHELSGEDYDKLFATYSGDGHLPTYVELLRLGAGPVPTGDALKAVARELLAGYLARRPAENPFTRFSAQLEADLPALIEGSTADYNAYAFHNPRMVGASMELLAGHVRWLFGERRARRPRPSSTTWSAARRCCSSGWPGSAPSTWPAWSRRWPRRTTPRSPSSTLWLA